VKETIKELKTKRNKRDFTFEETQFTIHTVIYNKEVTNLKPLTTVRK